MAARMTVSAGNVVDTGLSAVVTAAQGVSDVALASSKRSVSLLEEAWNGVDLTNLSVHQRHAERVADDPEALRAWLVHDFLDVDEPPPGAEAALRAIEAAGVSIPHAGESWQELRWPNYYREPRVSYDRLASGFLRPVRGGQEGYVPGEVGQPGMGPARAGRPRATLCSPPLPAVMYVAMTDRELEAARLLGAWLPWMARLVRAFYLDGKGMPQLLLFGQ